MRSSVPGLSATGAQVVVRRAASSRTEMLPRCEAVAAGAGSRSPTCSTSPSSWRRASPLGVFPPKFDSG